MNEELTKVFKDRVLKSAKNHIDECDNIKKLNDVFSLKMGMNIAEIERLFSTKLINLDSELHEINFSVEVEGINKLYFWIGNEIGLYSVFAMNEEIICDGFALNLKKQFFGYEKIFEVGYGRYRHTETQLDNLDISYNSWLNALENGSISIETVFNKDSGSILKNDIQQILIGTSKEVDEMPSIVIVYKFNNAK